VIKFLKFIRKYMFKIIKKNLLKYFEIFRARLLNLEKNEAIINFNIIFNKIKFLDKYFYLFLIISLIIVFIIFKTNFKTGMAGDDSRIYMFYPSRIYEHLSQRILQFSPDVPRMNLINTMYLFSTLEKIGFGYQEFYFIILILGSLFAYLAFKEILIHYNYSNPLSKYFILFLSLLYTSNPLMADQAWNNHYLSIFTIAGIPLMFLIFLKIIFNRINFIQIILLNLVASSLSAFFANAPQILAFVIAAGTMTIVYLLLERKNIFYFILNSTFFIILFILININWIYFIFFNVKNLVTIIETVKESSTAKSIPLLDFGWAESFNNFNYLFLNHVNPNSHADFYFYLPLFLFGLIIIYAITYIFINLFKFNLQNNQKDSFQVALFSSLIITGYLQSIALTKVGQIVFSYLVNYFSLLYSFRNYMNKIPTVYSFILLSAILVAYIKIPKKFEGFKLIYIIITILFAISSFRNLVLLEDYKFGKPQGYVSATKFDEETLELIDYIKPSNTKRITYLPLANSPYSIIKNEKELYAGLSPFVMLLEIDDVNGTFYFGDNVSKSYIDQKYLSNLDYEKLISLYSYLGVNKIIVNNDLDLDKDSNGIYNSEDNKNFEQIKQNLKEKNILEFETKNKKYSVYKFSESDIVFKKNIIKVDKKVPSYNFFKLDFANNTMSFENNLKDEFFNFIPVETKAFTIADEKNISKFYDSELNLREMGKVYPLTLYENPKSRGDKTFYLQKNASNILRIISNIPRDDLRISATSDKVNGGCLRNIFNKTECKIFKEPYMQKVGEKFSYTFDLGTESIFSLVNVRLRNDTTRLDDLDLQFYLGSNNKLNSDTFTQKDKDEYLKNLFISNPAAYTYQIPVVIENQKINNYEYRVKINLKENGLPFVLVLKDLLSDGWVLTGKGITDKTKFNADIQFNGWVIFPEKNVSNIEIVLKHQLNTKSQNIIMISDYSIKISLILLSLISIYGITKTIIRKYRR